MRALPRLSCMEYGPLHTTPHPAPLESDMTLEIGIVLLILTISVLLFVTEWVRLDVVELLVLGALALTGLVSPAEALSGFSSPAVVTVWAVLILSSALARTGVASIIGRRLLHVAGDSEARLLGILMLTVGVLSGFMNTIGVVSLFLPVVIDISRTTVSLLRSC